MRLLSHALGLFWLTLLLVVGQSATVAGNQEVRQSLSQLWESLATLEFRSEDRVFDEGGKLLRTDHIEFALAPDGRRSYKCACIRDGNVYSVSEAREDGRKLYKPRPFASDRVTLDSVIIQPQESPSDGYSGAMTPLLWLIFPGGKTMAAYLDADTVLEPLDPMNESGIWIVKAHHRGIPLRCELDPAHDWLPRRMTLEGIFDTIVTRFDRDNGRWFPVACEMSHFNMPGNNGKKTTERVHVNVAEFHINRPIPHKRFTLPTVPPGVLIHDMTTRRTHVEGGDESRRDLVAKHVTPKTSGRVTRPPIVVEETRPFPLGPALAGAILALLSAIIYTRLRGA